MFDSLLLWMLLVQERGGQDEYCRDLIAQGANAESGAESANIDGANSMHRAFQSERSLFKLVLCRRNFAHN